MKIFGIGVDIVEKRRIKKLIKDKKFLKRIYSENEIKFSKKIRKKLIILLIDLLQESFQKHLAQVLDFI